MTFTMLDLNRTISPLLKMIERLIGNDISINASLQPDLWPVSADPGSIERVIMNLTINARDAMPKGGAILIKSQNMVIDEKTSVSIPESRPGRYVCLSVADSGVGMPRETVQRIFEPFFTTKAAGKGSGLGLSVVYGIVQQHAGWINVSSELGQGSTFGVYLPAFPEGVVIAEKESGAGLEVPLR
jgi:signal transduction histidine kinase